MTIKEIYATAFEYYKAKKFDKALRILKKLKKASPDWTIPYLLEAKIHRKQGNFVRENAALKNLFPKFNLSDPQEKNLAVEALYNLATTYYRLAMPEKAVKNFCLSAQLAPDDITASKALSGAIFAACYVENFSAEDFRALYADYRKYTPPTAC